MFNANKSVVVVFNEALRGHRSWLLGMNQLEEIDTTLHLGSILTKDLSQKCDEGVQ
jgi:hypothetical protein